MTARAEPLPPFIDRAEIQRRLLMIFPEGTPNRGYCTREMAASTVFAMLYVGAVAGSERYLAPKQVYLMTGRQAERSAEADRLRYAATSVKPGFRPPGKRWYADTTREPIRDETLRSGLVALGAAVARRDIPTTSARPRYALEKQFAALFDPALEGQALGSAIDSWRKAHLTPAALARVSLIARGAVPSREGILVTFPSGETRRMAAGPSSVIAKGVIEEFAPRFLGQPAVILLSESSAKIVERDDRLATELRLRISAGADLPDVILVDLAPEEPILVFVEIVATDGAITAHRQAALLRIARESVFRPEQIAFVTAYLDRSAVAFRRTVSELAWRSFAWFASEPTHLVVFREGGEVNLPLASILSS